MNAKNLETILIVAASLGIRKMPMLIQSAASFQTSILAIYAISYPPTLGQLAIALVALIVSRFFSCETHIHAREAIPPL